MCGQVGLLWRCGIWLAIEVDFSFLCVISPSFFGLRRLRVLSGIIVHMPSIALFLRFSFTSVQCQIWRFWVVVEGAGYQVGRAGQGAEGWGMLELVRFWGFKSRVSASSSVGSALSFLSLGRFLLGGVFESSAFKNRQTPASARSNLIW